MTLTIQNLDNAELDTGHIAAIATSPAPTATDRLGRTKRTIAGTQREMDAALRSVGRKPPVPYAAGLTMSSVLQTVAYNGQTYAPRADLLPFETSGTFEAAKFELVQGVTGADLAAPSAASRIGFQQFNGTYGTVQDELRATVAMRQFPGWDPSGVAHNDGCYEGALSELLSQGGGDLVVDPGAVRMSGTAGADGRLHGMFVPYTNPNGAGPRVRIKAASKSTRLVAGSDDMILLRHSDSHGGCAGMVFDGSGHTGVWALGVLPESVTQTISNTYQLYNNFDDFYILNCEEGIVMQCGPRVDGSDSGCWYNNFSNYHIYSTKRARWLRAGPNAGASGVNANRFYGGRQGQNMNTGLQIDAGSGNQFYGDHNEGILLASGPNAVATAVKIAQSDVWGSSNDNNQFFGSRNEACTRQLDNENARTLIFGGEWDAARFTGVRPFLMMGGDPSVMPLILPGMTYAEGTPGYEGESGVWAMSKDLTDLGYRWGDWPISASNGRISGVSSTSSAQSKFRKQGGMVDWSFVVKFTAANAGQEIQIAPPVAPNPALYASTEGRNPFITLAVEDGSGNRKLVEAGWVNGTNNLYVKSPGNWNTGAGDNNGIFAVLRYHA